VQSFVLPHDGKGAIVVKSMAYGGQLERLYRNPYVPRFLQDSSEAPIGKSQDRRMSRKNSSAPACFPRTGEAIHSRR
jgi:hypothetical protein